MTTNTPAPQVGLFFPAGLSDAAHMYATRSKTDVGHLAYVSSHFPLIRYFKPDFIIEKEPFGVTDIKRFPFDSLQSAKAKGLSLLADEKEFIIGWEACWKMFAVPLYFYMGCTEWWSDESLPLTDPIAPILSLRDKGVDARLVIDSAFALSEESRGATRFKQLAGSLPIMGEPKPQYDWANKREWGTVTIQSSYHTMGGVPNDQLAAPIILLVPDPAHGEIDTRLNICKKELADGHSVAVTSMVGGFDAPGIKMAAVIGGGA